MLGAATVTAIGLSRWSHSVTELPAQVTIREVPLVQVSAHAPAEARSVQPELREKDRDTERVESEKELVRRSEPQPALEPGTEPLPVLPQPEGTGALTVSTDQPVQTFVYLNGGTLLGEAPLRNASVPAGKHRLVFWSPSVGGRSTRTVEVAAGQNTEVVEHVRARESFREETGG
jgi:hypothetical protein